MKRNLHRIAAMVATLTLAGFLISTMIIEIFGSQQAIATLKCLIVIPGLLIFIPALAITKGTGFALAKSRKGRLLQNKKRRMPLIGLGSIFILAPTAVLLAKWASAGSLPTKFYILQVFEIIVVATNLSLMSLSLRDGLKLRGRPRPKKAQ